jgi:hypothetical protein
LRQNKILWGRKIFIFVQIATHSFVVGECLSGALCESDLITAALQIGFTRPLLLSKESIGVNNVELQRLLGTFSS